MDLSSKQASSKNQTKPDSEELICTHEIYAYESTIGNASYPTVGSPESQNPYTLSFTEEELSGTSPFDKNFTNYIQGGGPGLTTMFSEDEIQFLSTLNYRPPSRMGRPTMNCEDKALEEPATSAFYEGMLKGHEAEILSPSISFQHSSFNNISITDSENSADQKSETPSLYEGMLKEYETEILSPSISFRNFLLRNISTTDSEDSADQEPETPFIYEGMLKGDAEILSPSISFHHFSFSNISTTDSEDSKDQEPDTPSSDDEDYFGYYEEDDDIERFCEQMAIAEETSPPEALKVEIEDTATSLPPSKEEREPISKFGFVEVDSTEDSSGWFDSSSADTQSSGPLDEDDILMQLQKFLVKNLILDRGTPLQNNVTTFRLFSDEFAREHGLTVDGIELTTSDLCDSTPDSDRNQERKPKEAPNASKNEIKIKIDEKTKQELTVDEIASETVDLCDYIPDFERKQERKPTEAKNSKQL